MLRLATESPATNSIAQMPKLDGFHKWRPLTRKTYFERIEIAAQSPYGHNAGERIRMPTLMPVIYALAGCGHCRYSKRPSTISIAILVPIASSVVCQLSRMPNDRCP